MLRIGIILFITSIITCYAYLPLDKDAYVSADLLRDVLDHMNKDLHRSQHYNSRGSGDGLSVSSAHGVNNIPSYRNRDYINDVFLLGNGNHNNMNDRRSNGNLDFLNGARLIDPRSLPKDSGLDESDDTIGTLDVEDDSDSAGGRIYPLEDYEMFGTSGENSYFHPSLRDQEYLQHSSLWGNQFMTGGAGEGSQVLRPDGDFRNRQEIKTDATLPAYCNPPNPCPAGYTADQGCLEDFENTASFSRRYQAAQDCMCDAEHMFDCPPSAIAAAVAAAAAVSSVASANNGGIHQATIIANSENNRSYGDRDILVHNPSDLLAPERTDQLSAAAALNAVVNQMKLNRFLQQIDPSIQHKNLVAKKFNSHSSPNMNPFLAGEKLPVAAKKGLKMYYN